VDASELAAARDLNERFAALWSAIGGQKDKIEESFRSCYQDFLIAVSDIRKKQADLEKDNERLNKRLNRLFDVIEDHAHLDGRVVTSTLTYSEND